LLRRVLRHLPLTGFPRVPLRAVIPLALVMPAAALAAEPIAPAISQPGSAAKLSGPAIPVVKQIAQDPPSRLVAARERERQRQRERQQQRQAEQREAGVHPVAGGAADYGDAQAAFGDARGRPHEGQDIFAAAGTPVLAPRASVVLESGSDGGRGNWIAVHDPDRDLTYAFFHLLEPAGADAGERLRPGQRIGKVGCTGSCFGDHLHFEVRAGRDPYGEARDPMPLLQRWEPVER
jgi:murein DD-endopeptidase MepM/ murein hydrolase activator NlpD